MSDEERQHKQVRAGVTEPEESPKDDAWAAPLKSITDGRQRDLRERADRQREWAAQLNPDPQQSAFAGVRLTGAEVFFLAVYERAGPTCTPDDMERVASRLRIPRNRGTLGRVVLHLEGADLYDAMLTGAYLRDAVLTGANLTGAHLDGANLRDATLISANLRGATMNSMTYLAGTKLAMPCSWRDRLRFWPPGNHNSSAALIDVRWGGVGTVDLTQIEWGAVQRLGDERGVGLLASAAEHEKVVRAYRQLAAQLRAQGMGEAADRFALRAHIRERSVLLRRWRLHQYFGSWFLQLLAGHGYLPAFTILWYVVVLVSFAYAYVRATHGLPIGPLHFGKSEILPLSRNQAFFLSVTAFHGRGFFQPVNSPGDPVYGLAALEAVVGLVIEVSFIATFTQRFFGSK